MIRVHKIKCILCRDTTIIIPADGLGCSMLCEGCQASPVPMPARLNIPLLSSKLGVDITGSPVV